jgi:hypothetical protein
MSLTVEHSCDPFMERTNERYIINELVCPTPSLVTRVIRGILLFIGRLSTYFSSSRSGARDSC